MPCSTWPSNEGFRSWQSSRNRARQQRLGTRPASNATTAKSPKASAQPGAPTSTPPCALPSAPPDGFSRLRLYPSAWLHPCRAHFRFTWQSHYSFRRPRLMKPTGVAAGGSLLPTALHACSERRPESDRVRSLLPPYPREFSVLRLTKRQRTIAVVNSRVNRQ
jgi:hypothetical protein